MPPYRSRTTTHGRNMADARGLWRATGMTDADFGKPIIAVVNSFTQFVPGHVHLKDLGQLVAREIEAATANPTIASLRVSGSAGRRSRSNTAIHADPECGRDRAPNQLPSDRPRDPPENPVCKSEDE